MAFCLLELFKELLLLLFILWLFLPVSIGVQDIIWWFFFELFQKLTYFLYFPFVFLFRFFFFLFFLFKLFMKLFFEFVMFLYLSCLSDWFSRFSKLILFFDVFFESSMMWAMFLSYIFQKTLYLFSLLVWNFPICLLSEFIIIFRLVSQVLPASKLWWWDASGRVARSKDTYTILKLFFDLVYRLWSLLNRQSLLHQFFGYTPLFFLNDTLQFFTLQADLCSSVFENDEKIFERGGATEASIYSFLS